MAEATTQAGENAIDPRAEHHEVCVHTDAEPVSFEENELRDLITEIKDYQITHGSLIKLVPHEEVNTVPAIPIGASVAPTPFPRRCFEQACKLQRAMNKLYIGVSNDYEWLERVLSPVIKRDEFLQCLWNIYCRTREEGARQPIRVGIFRSDYMLEGSSFSDAVIKQVEMNTYTVAGGTHANIVARMHHYLQRKGYGRRCSRPDCPALPPNNNIQGIENCLAQAFKLYGEQRPSRAGAKCILMLVQPFNVNICDERPIEYNMFANYGIHLFRVVFGEEFVKRTRLAPGGELLYHQRVGSGKVNVFEVAVAYMRAGYEPREFKDTVGEEVRLAIERSCAIKCPPISGHLATLKCVQQALYERGEVEHFLSFEESKLVRETFMPMYTLNKSDYGTKLAKSLIKHPHECEDYVLKPSLEGGGHNMFGEDIVECLKDLKEKEWPRYILMKMIKPPEVESLLISPADLYEGSVISELGILGACTWRTQTQSQHWCRILSNEQIGWTLKTKSRDIDEMSVVKGYGCFDCPFLVDDSAEPELSTLKIE